MLHTVATTVTAVTTEMGVDWLDVDAGVDSVKLMLTGGAPRAVDDDEDRLLLALRRIVDECPVPLRAGAQRGKVFAAPLGVAGRHTYTVIGDPVNVAARALGLADDGDVVVADGMDVDCTSSRRCDVPRRHRAEEPGPADADVARDGGSDPPRVTPRARLPFPGERGRRAEWQRLTAAWKRTGDETGAQLLLVSETGMGASSLLEALADLAGAASTSVVAHPFHQSIPYAALAELARRLARADGAETDQALGWLFAFADRLPADLDNWVELVRADVIEHDSEPDADPLTTAMHTRVVLAALLRRASPRPWLLTHRRRRPHRPRNARRAGGAAGERRRRAGDVRRIGQSRCCHPPRCCPP